jgi:hypothetical protein
MSTRALTVLAAACALAGLTVACGNGPSPSAAPPATPEAARAFADAADVELLAHANELNRAQWVAANFITTDTEALSASVYQD